MDPTAHEAPPEGLRGAPWQGKLAPLASRGSLMILLLRGTGLCIIMWAWVVAVNARTDAANAPFIVNILVVFRNERIVKRAVFC